jgi:hypothetical protein
MALLATTDTIPKSLRDTLVDVLRRADAADRFRDGLQNLRRTNKQFAILEQRLDNWTAVQREITYGIKLYADAEYLLDTMFNTGTMRTAGIGWDEEVAPEIIDGIIGQMPSMEKILGNYRGTLEDIEDIAGMTQAIDFGEVDPSGNISIRSGTKKGPSDVLSGGQLASQRAVGAGERITYGEMFDLLKKTRSDLYEMEREVVFSRKGPKGTTVDKVVRYRMADVLAADPTDPADRGWSASVRGHYNPERTDRFIDRIVSTSKSDKDVAAAAAKRAEFADPQEWFTKVSGLRQVAELNNLGRRTPGLKQIIGRAKVDARLADFLNGRSGSANISAYRALDVDLEKIEAGISTRLRNLSREMAKTPDDPLKIALHDDLRAAAEAVSSARRAIADVSMPTRGVSRTPRRVTGAMQTDRFGTAGATVGVDEFGDAIDVAGRTGKEVRVGTEAIRNKRGEIIGERTITADIPNIADEIELIRSEMRTLADDIKITSMPMGRARIAAREVGEGLGTAEDVKAARIAESIDLQDAWSAETKQLLEDTYQKAWFAAEVQKRFKRASDVLLANGLTPDVDFMRHIMNVVAKVFRNQLLSSQDDYSEALLVLGRLKATAENWGGDASELYHIMSEALNPVDAGGNLASWGQIVRNANGREDAQRLLATFKDYGGATNSGGFNSRRRWAERIIADPASTPERVALAKQRLAALPTKEKVAAGRKALKKELQKWYQQNVDSTRRAASWTEIETALQQYSAVARGRGRFTEGASVRSLRAWVESTEEAVRKAYANARQRTGWLSASADPYLSTEAANKILLGISDRTIAWDLPSFFASTMRTLADEYEARVLELGGAQQRAAARAGALSAEESAEALAKRKIVALEAKTSKPIKGFADAEQREVLKQFNVDELKELARDKGIEGYSKMSRASLEDALIAVRVDELDEARLIQKKLTQLKNTDEFAIALEQIRENDVLRILSSFNVDKPNTELVIREGAKKRTLRLLNEGQQIFRKDVSDAGEQYVQITKAREIKDGVQYYYKTKSPSAPYELIGDGAPKSLGVKFSPEEWSALWRGDSRRFVNAETNRFVMLQDELTEVRRQMEELSGVLNRSGVASYPPSELRRFGERMIVLRRRERNIAQKMYSIVGAEEGGVVLESLDFSAAARRAGEVHASAWEKFNLIVDAVRNGEIDINDLQNGLFTSVRKIDTKRQISVKRIVGQGAGHGGYDVIQGTDEAAGVITRVSFDSKRVASAADWEIADRAKMIDKSWSDSPNRLVYEQVQELEQDAASKLFNREMKNAESVLKRVRELRDKAEKAVAFKAEEGAPLGRYYDPSSRSWVVRRDLTEGAMIYNMQEGRVVPRNVQVAENRLATADALVAKRLEEVTASTARAGEPDYNAAERYAYFRSQDQSPTVAMDNVVDELRALRPSDERLVQIAGTKERLQRAEALRSSIPTMEYLSEGIALRLTFAEEEMATLKKLVPSLEKEMTKGKKTYLRERGKEAARLQKNIEKARTVVQRAESALSEAEGAYKTARLDAWRTEEWYKAWHARMAPKLEEIKSIVEAGAQGKEVAAGLSSASMRQAAMAEAQDWIDQVTTLMPELGMDADLVKTLQADYLAAQAMWLEAADEVDLYNQMLSPLNTTSWASKVVEDFDKGLVKLTQIGLPNYVARQSIVEMTENFHRLRAPEFVRGLNRLIGRYTGFFKASAVGTPGFVVRNTMSNTFMLVAAGGNPKTLFDGLGLFQAWKQAVSNGTERAWLDSLPAARRSVVETSIRAMDASGFGRGAEALNQWAPRGKFWTDNKYYRFIRRANETSEGSARFMLAYDTVMRGGSFDEATARVKRFLFDYTDISNADATIRSIVPFWFWMSRNFPLQIVNRWANPRAYNVYQSALRNLGIDEDADTNVPKWLRTQGAFPIGGDYYFAPDFGLSRVEQHLEELKDPKRLLAYVNPLLRVVPEVALMDKMMYRDVPFSERPQQPVGGPLAPAVQALAGLLGQSKRGREGEGVSEKLNYALMGLFPPIGQAERLLPATDLYEGRQTGSILSYLGVPVRQVTEEQREREERRQRREGE